MTEQQTQWTEAVLRPATDFPYPPTPDLAEAERKRIRELTPAAKRHPDRRLVWAALAAIALLLATLLTVPTTRAALLEWIQVGAIRIWLIEPTPTFVVPTRTPSPPNIDLNLLQSLGGETTLAAAQAQVAFTLRSPTYPADLGPPDRVYLQDLEGDAVVLVWLVADDPAQVRLTLHMLTSNVTAWKMQPTIEGGGYVHGQPALWLRGPYVVVRRDGNWDTMRLVQGHVLLWTEDEITYRLEGNLPLEEAIRVAESLK